MPRKAPRERLDKIFWRKWQQGQDYLGKLPPMLNMVAAVEVLLMQTYPDLTQGIWKTSICPCSIACVVNTSQLTLVGARECSVCPALVISQSQGTCVPRRTHTHIPTFGQFGVFHYLSCILCSVGDGQSTQRNWDPLGCEAAKRTTSKNQHSDIHRKWV